MLVAVAGLLLWACATERSGSDPRADVAPKGEGDAPRAPRSPRPPRPGATWQYQLTGELDPSVDAEVFDVDGDRTSAGQVDDLHRGGSYVICYLSAGSHEAWRDDASSFPEEVLGRPLDDWPDERWVDIRRIDVLLPILDARMERCANAGFDAVEPDNVDGWTNDTGFPLTADDQLTFNRALAEMAHRHGLAVGLKNDAEQVPELVGDFDFAVVEECVRYGECASYQPFIDAGKAVFVVEYEGDLDEICAAAQSLGAHAILKDLDLGPTRRTC